MNFDKNTGVIELIMDSLTPADEGTFTFQLQDGKATNQSSLVLIGDGMLRAAVIPTTYSIKTASVSLDTILDAYNYWESLDTYSMA